MERLTIPDKRIDAHTTRRTFIDASAVREDAMKFYWRLKAYEDTGLMPEDIPTGLQLAEVYCALQLLKKYEALGTPEELKALKEQAQREQGCEYCDFSSGSCGAIFNGEDDFFLITPDNSHEFYIATDGKGVFRETKIKFCPMCGRKLDGGGENG